LKKVWQGDHYGENYYPWEESSSTHSKPKKAIIAIKSMQRSWQTKKKEKGQQTRPAIVIVISKLLKRL